MREIKFRGKSVDGFWVSGSLLQREIAEKLISMICTAAIVDNKFIVKNETIGQFTGLCDCEGKEIYEGDVVRHENYICLVVYNSTRFASFALRKDGWAFDHYFGEAFEASECHVVGNIYDSPELLEKRR